MNALLRTRDLIPFNFQQKISTSLSTTFFLKKKNRIENVFDVPFLILSNGKLK